MQDSPCRSNISNVTSDPLGVRAAWLAPTAAETTSHLGIRTHLQHDHRVRGLAMFNLAIDSKLHGSCRCLPPYGLS
jgi:hypothetical protein